MEVELSYNIPDLYNEQEMLNQLQKKQKKVSITDFEMRKLLGSGGYGQVFLAEKVDGPLVGEAFALKVISKAKLLNKNKDSRYAKIERDILRRINSPFLCSMYYSFTDADYLYICLEYLSGGELFQHLERESVLTEKQTTFYAAEVILALEHLHEINVIYRDLKSENVMLDRHGHVKLTDFGLSKILDDSKFTKTFCGTIEFMAPEIIRHKEYSFEIDWWAMGVLIYDMMVGGSPFCANTKDEVKRKIAEGMYTLPYTMSNESKSIIKRFLVKDPSRRLGKRVDDIKAHRFFRSINWEQLSNLEIMPPFVPDIKDDFDVSQFDEDVVKEQIQLAIIEYNRRDSEAFKDFSYCAPFAMEVELTETWMLCEDSDDHSSADCDMEIEITISN